MSRWLAWTLGALFTLALVLHAHGPLLLASGPGSGFSASDSRALQYVSGCLDHGRPRLQPAPYFATPESGSHPLANASLAISSALWSKGGAFGAASPTPMRVENLVLLVIAAAGAGVFLRRLALPWLGDEHARAAAWVAAVLCVVHPLAGASLISIAARGDLLTLALGNWACAEFLRGRQIKHPRAAIRAGVFVLFAGSCSDLAWALPIVLALAESVSGRRYRPWMARVRTTFVTLVAYGLCIAVTPLLHSLIAGARPVQDIDRSAMETLALALEKLGVLALPVNPASASFAAYLLAAAVLVVALEPGFSAARSAPRLWSTILAICSVLVVGASFLGRGVRVQPGDFTHAQVLAPGFFVVSAGLALASTALGGLRRALMPAILATGWAAIAHEHAGAWTAAIARLDSARSDVARALEQNPPPAAVLLLDVPERVRGVAPLERTSSQGFLAAPEFIARDGAELEALRAKHAPAIFIAAPSRASLVQFSRTERFAQLREAGIAIAIDAPQSGERIVLRLSAPTPTTGPRRWFNEGNSSALDWDALTVKSVRARGPRDTDLARAPILGWNASGAEGSAFKGGDIQGVWVDDGAEPMAHFDVAASAEWLCSGRVLLAWPVGGWSNLSGADSADELAKFDPPANPQRSSDDWRAASLSSPLVSAAQATLARHGASGAWSLTFCNLETLEQERFDFAAAASDPRGGWLARGAGRVARSWSARGQPIAWCIEYRASGVVLVRDEGLLQPAPAKSR